MNQLIIQEFKEKLSRIQREYKEEEIDKQTYAKAKMILFKEYAIYKEELQYIFSEEANCFLSCFKEKNNIKCLDVSCYSCSKYTIYALLIRSMNHYL